MVRLSDFSAVHILRWIDGFCEENIPEEPFFCLDWLHNTKQSLRAIAMGSHSASDFREQVDGTSRSLESNATTVHDLRGAFVHGCLVSS
ncbi:MAG: hypothetical protein RJB11_166 [Planctomycetota bacterium]